MRAAPLLGLVALTLSAPASAGEAPVEIHGFLLGAVGVHTAGAEGERAGDYVLGEERLRLELGASSGGAGFFGRGDVFYDAVDRVLGGDLREAYVSYARGRVDVKAGRQIVTWGVGDVLIVNDYFPKDWESFFGGRPAEYLKLGVDALSARVSGATTAVDLVVIPFFTPDRLPSPSRFGLMDPYAGLELRDASKATFSDIELAARVSSRVGGIDLRLYGYRGRWREPSVRPQPQAGPAAAERFYPALSALGASAQGPLLGGVVALEAAYYDSRWDPRGDDPAIPNSQIRLLLSYQAQPWTEVTVSAQVIGCVSRTAEPPLIASRVHRSPQVGRAPPLPAPLESV